MEHNNYYTLLNFVSKVSKPKLKKEALDTHLNLDEKKGDTAVEIFENGIDNAEAVYAQEARRVLNSLKPETPDQMVDLNAPVKAAEPIAEDVKVLTETMEVPFLSLKDMENQHIRDALARFNNNKTRAAKALGITVKTLYNKLESIG